MAHSPKTPDKPNARDQVLALAKRLRTDPEFLAHVEGLIADAKKTHAVKLAAFNAVFTRKDVVDAMRDIQKAAHQEHIEGKDLLLILPHSDDGVDNAVAAAIVAAAASTAAAAFV
jgi:hypothetical protein